MSELRDLLLKARAIISDPSRWTTGQMARNAARRSINPNSQRAVSFCAIGAIAHVQGTNGQDENYLGRRACGALDRAAVKVCRRVRDGDDRFKRPAVALNDLGDHASVLRMYDFAIAAAKTPSPTIDGATDRRR